MENKLEMTERTTRKPPFRAVRVRCSLQMGAPANTTVLQTQRRAAEMERHGDAIRGSPGRMPTQPTADLSYINVNIDSISLMVKALHDSSSIGANATGDTSSVIFGQPGTKYLISPAKSVEFLLSCDK